MESNLSSHFPPENKFESVIQDERKSDSYSKCALSDLQKLVFSSKKERVSDFRKDRGDFCLRNVESNPQANQLTKKQLRIISRQEVLERRALDEKEKLSESLIKNKDIFGSKEVRSTMYGKGKIESIDSIGLNREGDTVILRGRLVNVRQQTSKLMFFTLREKGETLQCVLYSDEAKPREMQHYIKNVLPESIIEIQGCVKVVTGGVSSCSISEVEISIDKFHVISGAKKELPFSISELYSCHLKAGTLASAGMDTRLNNRVLDMRTPFTSSVLKIQSLVGRRFREHLFNEGFTEIHSPKIIGTASESGAEVFKLDYMGRVGYLAQSPQLYKQMAIQGDLEKVFEVGPIFRAENANTHRHLTEFTGLDLEMKINEHYSEVLDTIESLFEHIFSSLGSEIGLVKLARLSDKPHSFKWKLDKETMDQLGVGCINSNVVSTDKYGSLVASVDLAILRIPYSGAVELANSTIDEASKLDPFEDIDITTEKMIGKLIKERYGVDFYVIDHFPIGVRAFYYMPSPDNDGYSNSFDVFMRGEEICSGGQRIHSVDELEAYSGPHK